MLDLLQVISLWPRLLPRSTSFTRSVPALHDIADVNQMTRGEADKLAKLESFLIAYLEEIVGQLGSSETYTVLMKLYAKSYPDKAVELILADPGMEEDDVLAALEGHKRHHALALYYLSHKVSMSCTVNSHLSLLKGANFTR